MLISPAIPHYSHECLEDLGYVESLHWPAVDKKQLNENKVDYVIQINGKKRAILNENRDIDQESLLSMVKKNKLSNKYLENKSIKKIIFVKNRLMNVLLNE